MEEQKCEFCVWFDPDENSEFVDPIPWCNKWEVPTKDCSFCGWYVPKDI